MKDQTRISVNPSFLRNKKHCDPGNYPDESEKLPPLCKHHPVEQVSWQDLCGKIKAGERCGDKDGFIKRLNQMSKTYSYRLPTEAEWEYMASGGLPTEYPYGWGIDFDEDYASYYNNAGLRTHEVATKKGTLSPQNTNELIYDMAGNFWQWVWDWYLYFRSGPKASIDPTGPAGGSHRASTRETSKSDQRSDVIGFRLVRTPKVFHNK